MKISLLFIKRLFLRLQARVRKVSVDADGLKPMPTVDNKSPLLNKWALSTAFIWSNSGFGVALRRKDLLLLIQCFGLCIEQLSHGFFTFPTKIKVVSCFMFC